MERRSFRSEKMADKDMSCSCGMHLCKKCQPLTVLFGLLFLVAAFTNYIPGSGWTVLGVFFVLWGLGSMMMK